jgi:hypothetical protein
MWVQTIEIPHIHTYMYSGGLKKKKKSFSLATIFVPGFDFSYLGTYLPNTRAGIFPAPSVRLSGRGSFD